MEENSVAEQLKPQCVAVSSWRDSQTYVKEAQFSPDGTCVITNDGDNKLSTYLLPVDLLESERKPHLLDPYARTPVGEPIYRFAIYPGFDLSDYSSAVVLYGLRDHPIRLCSALTGALHATYTLQRPNSDAVITPHSLQFTSDGTQFLAGSKNNISLFDVNRPTEPPVEVIKMAPSKHSRRRGSPRGIIGIVSAMAINSNGLLCAATYNRDVGIYGRGGLKDKVAEFSVRGDEKDGEIGGRGVTQVLWSPCARYLYIAERCSNGALVYDVRTGGRKLATLHGRNALTPQRSSLVMAQGEDGHDLYGGGLDGTVRKWGRPYLRSGILDPDAVWHAHDETFIGSVAFHPTAGVAVTGAGDLPPEPQRDDEPRSSEYQAFSEEIAPQGAFGRASYKAQVVKDRITAYLEGQPYEWVAGHSRTWPNRKFSTYPYDPNLKVWAS